MSPKNDRVCNDPGCLARHEYSVDAEVASDAIYKPYSVDGEITFTLPLDDGVGAERTFLDPFKSGIEQEVTLDLGPDGRFDGKVVSGSITDDRVKLDCILTRPLYHRVYAKAEDTDTFDPGCSIEGCFLPTPHDHVDGEDWSYASIGPEGVSDRGEDDSIRPEDGHDGGVESELTTGRPEDGGVGGETSYLSSLGDRIEGKTFVYREKEDGSGYEVVGEFGPDGRIHWQDAADAGDDDSVEGERA